MLHLINRESAEEMRERIRAEIKAENERNLSNPALYLNHPKHLDGALHEVQCEQVNVTEE